MARTIQICSPLPRATALLAAAALSLPLLSGCANSAPEGSGKAMAASAGGPARTSPLGHYLSARLARDEQDTVRAADFYDIALAADPDNQALLQRTMVMMLAEGRLPRAIELAERRIVHQDDAAMARLILATNAIRAGDLSAARMHLQRSSRGNYMSLLQPMLLAWVEAGDDQFDRAKKALDQLRSRAVFAPFRTYHTALISDFAGYDEIAAAAFAEALKSSARRVTRVTLHYGGFLSRSGQRDKAVALFDGFLKRVPGNPVISHARDQLRRGKAILPPVNSVAEGVAEAFLSAGFAITGARGSETARIYSHLALLLRPDLGAARMLLAEVLEGQERFEDAIAVYGEIAEDSSFHWNARIRTAANMNNLDRIDETVALLRGMAKERADDTSALITVARILRSQDRFEEAIAAFGEVFERVGTLEQRHWSLLYERGIALERSKQWKAAEADFLKALEFRPDEPRVLNYLGYSWIDQGLNLDRARAMIEKAVSKRPNDGYVVDSLGWLFYRLGQYDEAVKHLERAVELRPQDPIINDHLGDAYWRAGRKLEAKFQWSHAIDLGAEEESIPGIQAKQSNGLGPPEALGRDKGNKSKNGG
ncbi:MAG: tetratricopeptide repeat protein [Alphaproteobacteria bacterium]|nr:tetratricopeptide repeat protein [Alphaproteobacteria bacterium]